MKFARKFESEFDTLVTPSRCTASLPPDLEKPYLVSEIKLDGSRYVFYIGFCPYGRRDGNTLLSRRISTVESVRNIDGDRIPTHVDRTGNIPHIADWDYDGLEGTILDGECFLKDFPTTSSIMGSGPAKAVQKQIDKKITYFAFDVMFFRGKDVRGLPLSKRRKILEEIIKRMNNPHVRAIPQWSGNIDEKFQAVVSKGGEGLIIKDIRQGYGMGWAKYKKSYDVSCVICGYKPGNGKYQDQIGAIELGVVLPDGKIHPIGWASGFDDQIRKEITDNQDEFLGKVVDIFVHEKSKPSVENKYGRLRHPTFHRFRPDVDASECTLEKLTADLKKKVKTGRWK